MFLNYYICGMGTKEITPLQYADYMGMTLQNVTKHIRARNELDHVISIRKYSRFYLLIVDKFLAVKSLEKARESMLAKYPYLT